MSDSYLDGKVREALLTAKGSRSMAQNLLMAWAMKDERLLRAMAQPFLKPISGAAVAGAIKRGVTVPGLGGPPPKPRPVLSKEDLAKVLSQVGQNDDGAGAGVTLSATDILGGPAAKAGVPAIRRTAGVGGGAGAGASAPADQASAIRTLAAVYARNRKRP